MYTEAEKRLNLIHGSPSFCLRVHPDGAMEVLQLQEILDDGHEYWVHANVTFACGQRTSAVFCIRAGGGEQLSIKIRINDRWFESDDPDFLEAAGLSRDQVFPIDWSYSIPVANDIYHKES
ncbi:MAG: hypothetical protein JRF72_09860 [Deltaproteobacteria bacterium]|jgi:hypothetical protein|nr:hypothetical protein [Deltaproteobacteria bacterium]